MFSAKLRMRVITSRNPSLRWTLKVGTKTFFWCELRRNLGQVRYREQLVEFDVT